MRPRHTPRPHVCAGLLVALLAAGCSATSTDQPADPGTARQTTSSGQEAGPGRELSSSPAPHTSPTGTGTATPTTRPDPATPAPTPPFISTATWGTSELGATLRVAPTGSGREASAPGDPATAWQEVLRLAPDADTPGMRAQFDCHWTWARILEPDKPTWNLEPWRPVVDESQMLAEGCNPGGPEV